MSLRPLLTHTPIRITTTTTSSSSCRHASIYLYPLFPSSISLLSELARALSLDQSVPSVHHRSLPNESAPFAPRYAPQRVLSLHHHHITVTDRCYVCGCCRSPQTCVLCVSCGLPACSCTAPLRPMTLDSAVLHRDRVGWFLIYVGLRVRVRVRVRRLVAVWLLFSMYPPPVAYTRGR